MLKFFIDEFKVSLQKKEEWIHLNHDSFYDIMLYMLLAVCISTPNMKVPLRTLHLCFLLSSYFLTEKFLYHNHWLRNGSSNYCFEVFSIVLKWIRYIYMLIVLFMYSYDIMLCMLLAVCVLAQKGLTKAL